MYISGKEPMNLAIIRCEQWEDRYRVVPGWGAYMYDGLPKMVSGGEEQEGGESEVCHSRFERPM